VFADALVPSEPGKSCRRPLSPDIDGCDPAVPFGRLASARLMFGGDRPRREPSSDDGAPEQLTSCNGYREAKPHGKPSLTRGHKALKYRHFPHPWAWRVYAPFIAPLKLPFKFEWP
jgi:hypothetical protein